MSMSRERQDRIRMADYDYELPGELIAQVPLDDRAASRLLVLDRATGGITHSRFPELPGFLEPGDLVVFNDSRVIPARLTIERESGGAGELLLLRRSGSNGVWTALGRPARRLREGERVTVVRPRDDAGPGGEAVILGQDHGGLMTVRLSEAVERELDTFGAVPLPPYITEELADRERYQTVYGQRPGSAAAPTAGLHFTRDMLAVLNDRGVRSAFVTLHVGLDTFRPVTVDFAERHEIHSEWCSVPQQTIDAIASTRARGGRVIAIGTTSARTLETLGQRRSQGNDGAFSVPTSIFITPGYRWTVVDGLLTNFHLPRSTLLLMVSALAGRDRIMRAYREAIDERYRFFSFGDAMLIV
jgi:S-adenosylmethionine:tRNA ribosyltransferase-isomerase